MLPSEAPPSGASLIYGGDPLPFCALCEMEETAD
jgi:hypothetical protein